MVLVRWSGFQMAGPGPGAAASSGSQAPILGWSQIAVKGPWLGGLASEERSCEGLAMSLTTLAQSSHNLSGHTHMAMPAGAAIYSAA